MKSEAEIAGEKMAKAFQLRRAQLLVSEDPAADAAADEAYLDSLVHVSRPSSASRVPEARPLTLTERQDVRVGRMSLAGEIMLRATFEAREAERRAWVRARHAGKSRGLQDQIKRLEAETHDRFGVDPA